MLFRYNKDSNCQAHDCSFDYSKGVAFFLLKIMSLWFIFGSASDNGNIKKLMKYKISPFSLSDWFYILPSQLSNSLIKGSNFDLLM